MALDYPGIIESESVRLVAAVQANRRGPVPWSDRWTVGTCAKHVGGVHHVVAIVIRDRPDGSFASFSSLSVPETDDPELGAWVTEGTSMMVDEMRRAEPDAICWSWHPDHKTAEFWSRRMAHETLVHRWDAEMGAGLGVAAMDPDVAADAVDEYLEIFAPTTRGLNNSPAGPTIGFEATDTGHRWSLQFPADGQTVMRRDTPDCAMTLSGAAEGLLLFGWGRLDPVAAGIIVDGDASLLDDWKSRIPPM